MRFQILEPAGYILYIRVDSPELMTDNIIEELRYEWSYRGGGQWFSNWLVTHKAGYHRDEIIPVDATDVAKMILAAKIVRELLDELNGRGGFDEFWGNIAGDTRLELRTTLEKIVLGGLTKTEC